MGLFGFLKSFGRKIEGNKEVGNAIPTVKVEKEIFDCYAEVFKREIANVDGLSHAEASEIYKLISQAKGGFLNLGAYYNHVYEKYFKDRDWAWSEYDKWNEIFTEHGWFPVSFKKKSDMAAPEKALSYLTVADLKNMLNSKNIEFSSKDKKQDLIGLAKGIPGILNEEKIKDGIAGELEKEKEYIYRALIQTINFRSKNLHDNNRARALGIKKFEINYIDDSNKKFVDLALKENPSAIPPFYPNDDSFLRSVFEFKD